jgi:hypothetical protein
VAQALIKLRHIFYRLESAGKFVRHHLAVLSQLPLASVCPSGEKAAAQALVLAPSKLDLWLKRLALTSFNTAGATNQMRG